MNTPEVLRFSVVVAFAAATQAITGFGFSLLALGALGWWMDLREASVLIAPAGLAMNVVLYLQLRSHFSWSGLVPLFVAALVAVPLGTILLLYMDIRVLELALAVMMLFTAVQGLSASSAGPSLIWHPVKVGVPCGVLGGLLTGAFGMGGPPVVSFLLNRPLNRFQFIASLQALFSLSAGIRVTQFLLLGKLGRGSLPVIVPAIVAAVMGAFVGFHWLRILSDHVVRKIVLWFVVACGVRYLWAALA